MGTVDFDTSLVDEDVDLADAQESSSDSTPATSIETGDEGTTVRSCLVELGKNIFNFDGLRLTDSEYKLHTLGSAAIPHNYTLFFNVCAYTQHRCSDVKTMDYANSVNNNQTCEHLSGSQPSDLKATLQDENHPEYGVNLHMTNGNACTDKKDYGLDL